MFKRKRPFYPEMFNAGLEIASYFGAFISILILFLDGFNIFQNEKMFYFIPISFLLTGYYFFRRKQRQH